MMSEKYKILGVDPGTNILGYGIIEVKKKKVKLITSGILDLRKFPDHQTKLKEIYLQLQEIIETYLPTVLAIEAPFFGKNVQSMLKLGRAQGVSMAAAITMGLKIVEYSPKEIKKSITGNGNSSKEQVSAMLEALLKTKMDKKYLDSSDAIGAAYTYFNQSSNKLLNTKSYSGWDSFIKDNPKKVSK